MLLTDFLTIFGIFYIINEKKQSNWETSQKVNSEVPQEWVDFITKKKYISISICISIKYKYKVV